MWDVSGEKAVNAKWRVCAIAGLVIVVAAIRICPQFQGTSTDTLICAASIVGVAMTLPWAWLCATDDSWLVRYAAACSSPLLLLAILASIAAFLMSGMRWRL